ncbi:MAG TPA: hypothetical protein VGP35_00515 [Terriglobales bacterium]|nr:hypothetical protein [Terriglobales bacterium]
MRNRYRKIICIAFVLASALLLQAQSESNDAQRMEAFQAQDHSSNVLLAAKLDESLATGASNEALPDAPDATTPDVPSASPTPSPAVKNQSHYGAPPAAVGGPLGVDRTVADRNYLLFTGAMFGSSVMNAELTLHCLTKQVSCNDVPHALQSRAALYGIGIPADLAISYLTYYMKKKHSHIWYAPSAFVTGANVFLGIRAYRWSNDPVPAAP